MIEPKRPPDYIERTKPEDPSDRPGQQTRDNVTPAIPSVKAGHVWASIRDVCVRCGRTRAEIIESNLECR